MATVGLYGSSSSGVVAAATGSESTGLYGNGTTFGGSYFEWFIFQVAEFQPATPTGGSWSFSTNSGTPPTGWTVDPPVNPTNTVWVSIALVNSKNASNLTWSEPGKFSFASGLPILSGNGAPQPTDGQSDQLYVQLDTSPQTIWFKESGTWTRLTGSTLYVTASGNQTIAGTKTFSSTIQGSVSGTAGNVTGIVAIANGGTGATTASGARAALSAAQLGANADITSMTGLTGGISTPDYIDFDTTATPARATGRLWWDNSDGIQTLNLGMAGSNATMQIGEETYYRIKATSAITEGQVVMFTGTVGASGALTGAPAYALTADTASYLMGIATENISVNGWGYITAFGLVRGIDTTGGVEAWADGDILYYNPLVAGGLTNVVPAAPNAKIQVCAVVHAANNGSLFVRPTYGGKLGQFEGDVQISSPVANNSLFYTGTRWENYAPSAARTALGLGTSAVLNAGTANGVATLDAGGTVPLSQLPASIQGGVSYQGSWNASTNTPTLTSSVGSKGYYYVVSVAGSTNLNGITDWLPGDWAIFNGTAWEKIDNTDAVSSVNGYTGAVSLTYSDVNAPSTTGTNASGTWAINISGNAATATTSTNVSGGSASVTSLTNSGSTTLTSGTANGVTYLNGSKVLTSGSALTFDGAQLGVNGITVGRGAGAVSTNTAVGASALAANTSGVQNTAVGYQAAQSASTATNITAVGHQAANSATGDGTVAVGTSAAFASTGADNTAMGAAALLTNSSGAYNTAIGRSALRFNTTASNNTAVGYQALYSNTTGADNAAFGFQALYSNTTALNNSAFGAYAARANTTGAGITAIGNYTLYSNTTGEGNVAVGGLWQGNYAAALYANTTGNVNTAVGAGALRLNTTGNSNTAHGGLALYNNTTASYNTAVGYQAAYSNVTGTENATLGYLSLYSNTASYNSAFGGFALFTNSTGTLNTAIGHSGLRYNTTGSYNTSLGNQALFNNTTANYNTAVGHQAAYSNSTGTNVTAVGYQAGFSNTGDYNVYVGNIAGYSTTSATGVVAVGRAALFANTTGSSNIAMGQSALTANTTGDNNTAIGHTALFTNTTAPQSTAVGYRALYSATGGYNTAIGFEAGKVQTTGDSNTYLGRGVASTGAGSTGSHNTAIGNYAIGGITSGSYNVAVGSAALSANTTASNNTAVGYQAGYSNTTGPAVTYLGKVAGYSATGGYNTFVGDSAGYYITSGANNTILGRYNGNQGGLDIRTSNNYIVLSDGDGNPRQIIDSSGNLLVGKTTNNNNTAGAALWPQGTSTFVVSGDICSLMNRQTSTGAIIQFRYNNGDIGSISTNGSSTAYNTSSDYRLKNTIAPMTGALAKVVALKPCTYKWNADGSDGEGFIAHELAEVCPQAVTGEKDAVDENGNPKYQGIDTSFLVATLTAAIQELKAEFDAYKATHP